MAPLSGSFGGRKLGLKDSVFIESEWSEQSKNMRDSEAIRDVC